MPRYEVHLGSLVTKLMQRKFIVSANSELEAIEKAEKRFCYAAEQQKYTEVGGTIIVDDIKMLEDKQCQD